MNNLSQHNLNRSVRVGRVVVVGIALLMGMLVWSGFDRYRFHNDFPQYDSTARNLRDSGELATSIIFYREQRTVGEMPALQTVFPPGYPALVATATELTQGDTRLAGFAVNLVSYVLVGIVLFELCQYLGGTVPGAILCSILWLCLGIAVHCTQWGISEPPFMLCQVVAVRLLATRNLKLLALAGLFASFAITIRYSAVFLVLTVALAYLFALIVRGPQTVDKRRLMIEAITFGVLPGLTVGLLFLRNALLVNTPLVATTLRANPSPAPCCSLSRTP